MLAVEPSPISARLKQLPTELTPLEWSALAIAVAPGGRHVRGAACRDLHRVLDPLAKAAEALRLDARTMGWVQRVVLRGMHGRHTACGSWDADDWIAVAKTAHTFRGNVVAVAWLLERLTIEHIPAAGVRPTDLARRLFGRSQLEREVDRIRAHLQMIGYGLQMIGYGRSAMSRRSLMTAMSILFLRAGRAELEALTVEHIQDARRTAPVRAEQRRMYYRRGPSSGLQPAWSGRIPVALPVLR